MDARGRTDRDDTGTVIDDARTKLSRLRPGDQFVHQFDFGDSWPHLLTVADRRVDPPEELGIVPPEPTSHLGRGAMPDQYGRRFEDDDGEGPVPKNPGLKDLPPIEPW